MTDTWSNSAGCDVNMKNIVLVGFMGTGKTMAAKALARDMDKTYVSTDDLIEAREKKTIKDIFAENGEPYFRDVEKKVAKEISKKTDQIVDAGGGIVLDGENMKALREGGIIICLWADPAVIYQRTKQRAHRPLLNVEDPEKRIKELLNQRRRYYEKADFHIDTTDFDIDMIVDRIKRIVYDEGKKRKQ